jgi:hypothetical protein
MNHLPRNGQYEIFTNNGRTYCFDDPDFAHIPTPPDMFEWIRSQDTAYWHAMKVTPHSNTALYLQPELYFAWKLKFL